MKPGELCTVDVVVSTWRSAKGDKGALQGPTLRPGDILLFIGDEPTWSGGRSYRNVLSTQGVVFVPLPRICASQF